MNRWLKPLALASIVGIGVAAAALFRTDALSNPARPASPYAGPEFRGPGFADGPGFAEGHVQTDAATSLGARRQQAPFRLETMRVPTGVGRDPDEMYQDHQPPRFPSCYPSQNPSFVLHTSKDGDSALPAWTPLFGDADEEAQQGKHDADRQPVARHHAIKDGDTLRKLAARYLGDADRWQEIYDANRGALTDPELLTLGTVVTIPPRAASAPTAEDDAAGHNTNARLVPIPRGALRREQNSRSDER